MKVVAHPSQVEESIKKSRFIAYLFPCATEQQALVHLRELHVKHADASHVVYAYRILTGNGLVCRFNDAGEPSGTAGKPIFQHLEGKQLINVLVAVVRYFGGVKLGAGGLTRAYGNSARLVIDQADTQDYVEMVDISLTVPYNQLQGVTYHLEKLSGEILSQEFNDNVYLRIRLPKINQTALTSLLGSEAFKGKL